MKGFWKWFFIVLGALVLAGIAFCVTMLALRGGSAVGFGNHMRGFGVRTGFFGGMMGGMGFLMLFRGLIPLGVLVLAGFGVAYLVRYSKRNTVPAVAAPVCAACGKPLASDWKACPHCGKVVETPESPVTTR